MLPLASAVCTAVSQVVQAVLLVPAGWVGFLGSAPLMVAMDEPDAAPVEAVALAVPVLAVPLLVLTAPLPVPAAPDADGGVEPTGLVAPAPDVGCVVAPLAAATGAAALPVAAGAATVAAAGARNPGPDVAGLPTLASLVAVAVAVGADGVEVSPMAGAVVAGAVVVRAVLLEVRLPEVFAVPVVPEVAADEVISWL